MAGPNVVYYKRLLAGGYTPRGSGHIFPIQPVDSFTVQHLFSTQDLIGTGISGSLQYDIREAQLSGQEQTESPGDTTVLVVMAIIGVQVTDHYVAGFEIEMKRDADVSSRFLTSGVRKIVTGGSPLDADSIKPTMEMDPLIIPRLQSGATYEFKIKVMDTLGNKSDASNGDTFISKVAGSITLPTAPLGEIIHDYAVWEEKGY